MRRRAVLGFLAIICCSAGSAYAQPEMMVVGPGSNSVPVQKTEPPTPGRLAATVNLTDQQRRRLSAAGEHAIYGPRTPISKERVAAIKRAKLGPAPTTVLLSSAGPINDRDYWGESRYTTLITQSETSSAVYSKHVVIGWNDFESYYFGGYSSISNWAVSHNGGTSFMDKLAGLPTDSIVTETWGDPAIAVGPDGTFYFATLAQVTISATNYSGIAVYRSTDRGESFSWWWATYAPDTVDFLDKEAIAVDPNSGKVYVTYTYFDNASYYYTIKSWNVTDIVFATIDANDYGLQGTSPAVDRNGNLSVAYESWDSLGNPSIKIAKSTNHGSSFGSPVEIAAVNSVYDDDASYFCRTDAIKGNIRLLELPSLAIDTRTSGTGAGTLYGVVNARNGSTGNIDVYITKSTNGGATWSAPIIASTRPTGDISDKFLPWVTVNKNGEVALLYYDRRNHPGVTGIDNSSWWVTPYLKRFASLTLGVLGIDKLGREFPVVTNNDYTAACYMGDYNSVSANRSSASTDSNFYVFWGDNGFGDPDVRFSKVAP